MIYNIIYNYILCRKFLTSVVVTCHPTSFNTPVVVTNHVIARNWVDR